MIGRIAAWIAGFALIWICACTAAPREPVEEPDPAAHASPAEPPPAGPSAVRIERVRELGPYVEARVVGRAGRRSFLFVGSADCRRTLRDGQLAQLEPARPLGRVIGPDGTGCAVRGISELAGWRDAVPDRRASFLVPTAPAELRLLQELPGLLLAAGKLPLALELRWATPLDVVALLPDTPACRAHLARASTQMEFRARGEDALVLRGRLEACPILALAEPVLLD